MAGLRAPLFEGVRLVPPKGRRIAEAAGRTVAGVFDRAGDPVAGTIIRRRGKDIAWAGVEGEETELVGEAVYCGLWIPAFGHFLLESLSRLWYLRAHPHARAVWLTADPVVRPWQAQLLALLGIRNEIVLIDRPTRVERLIVPTAGLEIGDRPFRKQAKALAVVEAKRPTPGKRVWLSRSALADGTIKGETAIERRLAKDWIIFHPEAHTIAEQVAMLSDAERIAGFAGSALHILVLFNRLGAKIDIFARDGQRNTTFEVLAEHGGWVQSHHVPAVVPLAGRGASTNHLLVDGGDMLRHLLPGGTLQQDYTPERETVAGFLNEIVQRFEMDSYLEIGVASGATFFGIDAPRMVAVDPLFRFPYWRNGNEKRQFHEMSSDDYFSTLDDRGKPTFDLIFLDGLHTFDQTYRDFLNSLEVAHDETIWLIDDTIPSDAYGAWPEQEIAVRLRGQYQPTVKRKGAWQGDVFKVIVAIHDFHPGFSFATVENQGKLHTLAWRERRRDFAPALSSMEAIARMSFIDFLKHRELFNFADGRQILDHLKRRRAVRHDRGIAIAAEA